MSNKKKLLTLFLILSFSVLFVLPMTTNAATKYNIIWNMKPGVTYKIHGVSSKYKKSGTTSAFKISFKKGTLSITPKKNKKGKKCYIDTKKNGAYTCKITSNK